MNLLLMLCVWFLPLADALAEEPLVRSGDTLALVGGTLVESMQTAGECEAAVVLASPELRVPFRNLGWSGDDVHGAARRVFGTPEEGYARLMRDVEIASPTVALVAYGFAEASNGPRGLEAFQPGLERLAGDLESRGIRRIYALPFPLPGVKTAGYASAMEQAREMVRRVAAAEQSPVIDPFTAVEPLGAEAFDEAGLRLSDAGHAAYGRAVAAALLGMERATLDKSLENAPVDAFRTAIAEKNSQFFHRYRPMNETYLFLFRKHEQGNNAAEVERFEPLVEQAEQALWQRAASR